jgi:hypothetical protein
LKRLKKNLVAQSYEQLPFYETFFARLICWRKFCTFHWAILRRQPLADFSLSYFQSHLFLNEETRNVIRMRSYKQIRFLFTGLLRQAVSKGLCCMGTSISDIGTDLVPEVVRFKKQIEWPIMPKVFVL